MLITISAVTSIASIMTLNLFLIAFTAILVLISVILYKLWYVIDALVFRHTNLIEIFNGYELSGDRLSAIRRINEAVSSTTAAVLEANSTTEIDRSKIENIIAHINYPFKFVMQVERLNVNKITDKLETSRSLKEIELSRIDQSNNKKTLQANQLKRELEQIQHDINAIKVGETPVKLIYYIMTSSLSETIYDAEERAKSQIRELSSQFDALLKSKSKIVTGNELITLLQIDSEMML